MDCAIIAIDVAEPIVNLKYPLAVLYVLAAGPPCCVFDEITAAPLYEAIT